MIAYIIKEVTEISVVNPLQFKIISESIKNAEVTAEYLSKGLLPIVRVMGKGNRRAQSKIKNKIGRFSI